MSTCTHCGLSARWRADGEPVCGSHATDAALRGRRVELLPAPPKPSGVASAMAMALELMSVPAEADAAIDRMWGRVLAAQAERLDGAWADIGRQPAERPPARPADVVDRLEAISGWDGDTAGVELCMDAAAEIRRLRARVAELEAGQTAAG